MENENNIYEDSDVKDFPNYDKPGVGETLIAYAVCTVIGLVVGIAIGLKIE